MEIAARNRLPLVNLTESGGADLPHQAETFVPGGASFREITRLSKQRIPSICLVFGSSTAGGAYQPGMSDYVIGVKNNGMAALAGAALVRAATGEVADDRELGGSEMHASVSGLVEYLAEDDAHGQRHEDEVPGDLAHGIGEQAAEEGFDLFIAVSGELVKQRAELEIFL